MRYLSPVLLVLMGLSVTTASVAEVSAVDDTGQTVRLSAPAQRVISLAPHITELLFAAGAGDRIVAAVEFSDFPAAARALPRVGDSMRLDRERIVVLKPDLVVAWGSGNPATEIAAVRRLGIPVFISEPRRLADIPRQIEALGTLAGEPAIAADAARNFLDHLADLRATYRGKKVINTYFQVAGRPLITISGNHLISDIVELCGGRNLFGNLPGLAPGISIEAVLAAAPQVILYSEYAGHEAAEIKLQWSAWQTIPAVSHQQIYGVPSDLINRAGPRVLAGADSICASLEAARGNRGANRYSAVRPAYAHRD